MNFYKKLIKSSQRASIHKQVIRQQESTSFKSLHTNLQDNIQQIKESIGNSADIIIREISIGKAHDQKMAIIYTDGLADGKVISNFILESVLFDAKTVSDVDQRITDRQETIRALKDLILTIGDIKEVADFESLYNSLLSGDAIILLDKYGQGIATSTRGWKDRSVTEPSSESIVRGPREAFTETLRTNTALIRRKIKNPNLWMETKQIGRVTRTDVAIMYIQGIVNDKALEEVRKRLDRIDIDGILESGYIEELIQDETFSPFPTVYNSERPDVIAAELLEGKIAILIDGTPFVLVVPALLVSFLHAAEDYYHRADISSLIRLLRYIGMLISLLAPSLYIAISTYHQEMLPTELLITLTAAREGVPFPAFIEALTMEVTFEILREAGIRMPRTIGPAVSIVGTLVIGSAAVEAGIVSPAMVIIVSITAISNFIFPSYSLASTFRILRFMFMILAAVFGLFGIIVGIIALVLHLSSLRSFGIPYTSPFAPLILADQKDTLIRVPWWAMFSRPRLINQKNIIRERNNQPQEPEPRQ